MDTGFIEQKRINDKLYRVYHSHIDSMNDPVRTHLYWILAEINDPSIHPEPIPAQYYSGIVSAHDPDYILGMKVLKYSLPGDKHADLVENIPIPCPKVRAGIETRYKNERWQKYLKSSGWVTA